MLIVDHIGKDFPSRSGTLTVLDRCTFSLKPGESLAILGPSGSGKSTLLNILGTLEPPTRGRFELEGESPMDFNEQRLAKFRREKVAFVFQDHHLLPQCTALENVLIPFLAEGKTTPSQREQGIALLERFGLKDRLDHRPGELSGGEKQRVAIARALVRGPRLLLADEPTGSLDRSTAASIAELFLSLLQHTQEHALMLILATHDPTLAKQMKFQKTIEDKTLITLL